MAEENFNQWAVVEVMGKSRYGGLVREADAFGVKMVRVDVPKRDGEGFEQSRFFHPNALFCITPVTEEIARAVAARNHEPPVYRYELPAAKSLPPAVEVEYPSDDEENDDYDGETW
jgi:hypothetical protein